MSNKVRKDDELLISASTAPPPLPPVRSILHYEMNILNLRYTINRRTLYPSRKKTQWYPSPMSHPMLSANEPETSSLVNSQSTGMSNHLQYVRYMCETCKMCQCRLLHWISHFPHSKPQQDFICSLHWITSPHVIDIKWQISL